MSTLPAAVSFDLDGCLYPGRRAAWRVLLRMPHRLRFLARYGRVRKALRRQSFADGAAFKRAEIEALAQALRRGVEETARLLHQVHDVELCAALGRAGPHPQARRLLQALRERRVPVAVLSDLPVDAKLRALGLGDLDYAIKLDAGDTGALKPNRRPFEVVAEALGVPLDDLWHVGDRHDTDVLGAEGSGATAVWLTAKADKPVLPTTRVIADLGDLFALWGLSQDLSREP